MGLTDTLSATLLFNLQILPESLIAGILLLSLVLANPAVLAMAAGGVATQLLTNSVGLVIMRTMPASAKLSTSMDMCNNGFLGKSWIRLLGGGAGVNLWHPLAPTVYMATIGYFVGYGIGLQQLYTEEIRAGIMNSSSLIATSVVAGLVLLLALVFRIASGCETVLGSVCGAVFGFLLGYLGCILLGYATDRRGTNIWGIPLLRDRINGGGTVYVCDA